MAFAAGSTPGRIGRIEWEEDGARELAKEYGIGLDGKPCEEALGRGTEGERGDAGGNAGHGQQGRGRRQFGER